jgi:hypothetical protein
MTCFRRATKACPLQSLKRRPLCRGWFRPFGNRLGVIVPDALGAPLSETAYLDKEH